MEKIMKIAITSESVCDLNKEFKEKYNIQTLPNTLKQAKNCHQRVQLMNISMKNFLKIY